MVQNFGGLLAVEINSKRHGLDTALGMVNYTM